jgi:hypothetical protein
MADDIIVAEVRQQRAQLLEAAGGSLTGLVKLLRAREEQAGRQSITLPFVPAANAAGTSLA